MPDITHTYTYILLWSRYAGTGATHTWTSKLGTRSGLSWRWESSTSGLFSSQVFEIKMFYRSGDTTLGGQHDYKCCRPPRFVNRFWNLLSMQTICHWCSPPQLTLANIYKVTLRKVAPSMKVEPSVFFTSRYVPLSTLITKCTKNTHYTVHANSQDPFRLIKFSLTRRSSPLTSMDRWTNR